MNWWAVLAMLIILPFVAMTIYGFVALSRWFRDMPSWRARGAFIALIVLGVGALFLAELGRS